MEPGRSLTDAGPGEGEMWGWVMLPSQGTPRPHRPGRNDKAQLAESPVLQRVGRAGPFRFLQAPQEEQLEVFVLSWGLLLPRRGGEVRRAESVRAETVQRVIYFPESNVFLLSLVKAFPVNPPPVIHVGCAPAAQNSSIDASSHDYELSRRSPYSPQWHVAVEVRACANRESTSHFSFLNTLDSVWTS